MSPKPPAFTAAALWVSLAAADDASDDLLQAARASLVDRPTLSCRVTQTSQTPSGTVRGEGTYLAGRFPRLRLETTLTVVDSACQCLDVCDGQVLWSVRDVRHAGVDAGPPSVTRRDVERVWQSLAASGRPAEARRVGDLAAGGLPGLIAGIADAYAMQEVRGEAGVRRMAGGLREGAAERLDLGGARKDGRLPETAVVDIDAATLLPRRVAYYSSGETPAVLHEIRFEGYAEPAADPAAFTYTPPRDVDVSDRTDATLAAGKRPAAE